MRLQTAVLQWYSKDGRKLPWRETTDLYKILVSEMMLQQTQVERVVPKYTEFLSRFPTAQDLAGAPPGAVIEAWAGLGYNRRALHLQQAAEGLLEGKAMDKLPGVGPYTAAALSAFARNEDVAVLDTNVRRVVGRLFFGRKDAPLELIQGKAWELVPPGKSREWHNALMDVGSLFCASGRPRCSACPAQGFCAYAKKPAKEQSIASRQGRFAGSKRFYRGQVVSLLRKEKAVTLPRLQRRFPEAKAMRTIVNELASEGLVVREGKSVRLP